MSTKPGEASGYALGPAAVIAELETRPRKLTDHMFPGPDYSIVHPGIFPHNVRAGELATISEWVEFDYEAGWGTDAFEDSVSEEYEFPIRWWSIDERYDAREIIEENRRLLASHLDAPVERSASPDDEFIQVVLPPSSPWAHGKGNIPDPRKAGF